jgi:hypothetical protein
MVRAAELLSSHSGMRRRQAQHSDWGFKDMAAPYNPPTKNEDFIMYVALNDMNVAGSFKANPTIATSDWKISKDGGSLADLTTLPTVAPAGSIWVKITLSNTEMNADSVSIQGIDQTSPKEWADFALNIPTTV